MRLDELERWIHRAVKEETPVADAAAALGADPRRLELYRGMVRGHVRSALDACFDILLDVLGTPLADALYEDFLGAWQPSHWVLSRGAEGFPDFLADQVVAGREGVRPFHVSLAELEWAAYETRVHPAPIPPAVDAPTLNPTLTVLQTAFPVVPFAVAWENGRGPAEPDAEDAVSLLFQRPETHAVCWYAGTPALLFALKATHDGLTAEAAAEATGEPLADVRAALAHAASIGLVLAPRSPA